MPTDDEIKELLIECKWSNWITDYDGHKGVNGYVAFCFLWFSIRQTYNFFVNIAKKC